jgi:hypothetical protein
MGPQRQSAASYSVLRGLDHHHPRLLAQGFAQLE